MEADAGTNDPDNAFLNSLTAEQLRSIVQDYKLHCGVCNTYRELKALYNESQPVAAADGKRSYSEVEDETHEEEEKPPAKKQRKKTFNMDQYHLRHIALKIAYLGWPFTGFAAQPIPNDNSIEVTQS